MATIAPFIRKSKSYLTVIKARVSRGRGGVDLSSPIAAAIIMGRPDKSTNRGMLTNSGCPDSSTSGMGIYPTINIPAAKGVVTGVRGDKNRTGDKVRVVLGKGRTRKSVASASKLRLDTYGPKNSIMHDREVEGRGCLRGVSSWGSFSCPNSSGSVNTTKEVLGLSTVIWSSDAMRPGIVSGVEGGGNRGGNESTSGLG